MVLIEDNRRGRIRWVIFIIFCTILGLFMATFLVIQRVKSQNVFFANRLAIYVSEFAIENKRLPSDWSEFERWAEDNKKIPKFNKAELGRRFRLAWNTRIIDINYNSKLIVVLDRNLIENENNINQLLISQIVAAR